jgi:hypothetical protein
MTPAELNSLRDKMADDYYEKGEDEECNAFKAGFKASLEIGKTLGRAEMAEQLASVFNSEAERIRNQNTLAMDLDKVGAAFAGQRAAAMLCESEARAEREKLEKLK